MKNVKLGDTERFINYVNEKRLEGLNNRQIAMSLGLTDEQFEITCKAVELCKNEKTDEPVTQPDIQEEPPKPKKRRSKKVSGAESKSV